MHEINVMPSKHSSNSESCSTYESGDIELLIQVVEERKKKKSIGAI